MILYQNESYKIMGAVFEVYKTIGYSFIESFYQRALEYEFKLRNIPFDSQKTIPAKYKGIDIGNFRPDFVCYDKIIVEIKSIENIGEAEIRQVLNYLNVSGYELGILVNFGSLGKVTYRRIVKNSNKDDINFAEHKT